MTAFVRLFNNRPHIVRTPIAAFADPLSVDDLFADIFRSPSGKAGSSVATIQLDVTENAQAYNISAALPGVKKDDIELLIDKNTVTINAQTQSTAANDKGTTVLHHERAYGKLSRTVSLVGEVDEANTNASYVDGVLTLTLAKKLPAQAKRITIN